MTSAALLIRTCVIVAPALWLAACNGNTEPLPAPTAQETLESMDDIAGGPNITDETPDAPPEPE